MVYLVPLFRTGLCDSCVGHQLSSDYLFLVFVVSLELGGQGVETFLAASSATLDPSVVFLLFGFVILLIRAELVVDGRFVGRPTVVALIC